VVVPAKNVTPFKLVFARLFATTVAPDNSYVTEATVQLSVPMAFHAVPL